MDENYSFPDGKTLAVVLNDSKEKSAPATLVLAVSTASVFDLEGGKLVSFPIGHSSQGNASDRVRGGSQSLNHLD